MSAVDVYTDIILRTAQARGELKSFSTTLTTEVQKWAKTSVSIATTFSAPDMTAVQQRIKELQGTVVEIPVRYVTQGQAAAGAAAVSAAAQQTINTSALGDAVKSITDELNDLAFYLARTNAGSRGASIQSFINGGNGGRSGGGGSGSGGGGGNGGGGSRANAGTRSARRRARAQARFARMGQNMGNVPPNANNGGGYNGGGISNRRRRGGGGGGGGGHGGRRIGGSLGAMIRSHPSLSRLFGGLGVAYEASALLQSGTAYGDSDYIPTGNIASLATRQISQRQNALRSGIQSTIPVFGGMATGAADFAGSALNWGMGNGFVTADTRRQYIAGQQDLASDVDFEGRHADIAIRGSKNRDPVKAAFYAAEDRATDLEQKLLDAKYRDRNDPTELNESGKKLKADGERRNTAQADRERQDASAHEATADDMAVIDQRGANRRAFSNSLRSENNYGRQAKLDDALGAVDDRIDKRRKAVKDMVEGPEKERQNRLLRAEEEEAEQEKAAKSFEARKQWAIEDAQIVASTEAANMEATGDYYDAAETQAKAAAKARIDAEEDVAKKTKIILEEQAKESARQYKVAAEARQRDNSSRAMEMRTGGRSLDAQKRENADELYEAAKEKGFVDKNGRYLAPNEANANTGKAFTDAEQQNMLSLYRRFHAQNAEAEKQYRFGTEDRKWQAEQAEAALNGNRYGADKDRRQHERDRELSQHSDQSPEGQARRDAINRSFNADQALADRQHGDDLRDNNLQARQSELRMQGRERAAQVAGEKVEAAKELRDNAGDPAMLESVRNKWQKKFAEEQMGSHQSEIFGSVAEYANNRIQSAGSNSDQGAYSQLKEAAEMLKGLDLSGPLEKIGEMCQAVINNFNTL